MFHRSISEWIRIRDRDTERLLLLNMLVAPRKLEVHNIHSVSTHFDNENFSLSRLVKFEVVEGRGSGEVQT